MAASSLTSSPLTSQVTSHGHSPAYSHPRSLHSSPPSWSPPLSPSSPALCSAPSTSASPTSSSLLKDDYGTIDVSGVKKWICPSLTIESGDTLTQVPVAYQTYGSLNAARDNVLVVCHALTGHAALHDWWGSLLGSGMAFDTTKYFVVCANLLGSCYGTAGPTELNPATGQRWGADFPVVTVRDSVQLHQRLVFDGLGAKKVAAVIGGSLGGMQALEWGFSGPSKVGAIVALSCNSKHSAWQLAINHVQRQAIYADPHWAGGRYTAAAPPASGLSIARQFAMITYRTQPVYQTKFGRSVTAAPSPHHKAQLSPPFEVERYLLYQGAKLLTRFDANSYVRLTQVLDSHDVARGRGDEKTALAQLEQPTLVMGVDSDVLYPMHEQEELASMIKQAAFVRIHSLEGHDGFLLEQEQIGAQIIQFLAKHGQPDSERSALKAKL